MLFVDFAPRWREVQREREVDGPRVLRRAPLRGSVRGGPGEGESERVRGRRWGVRGRPWGIWVVYIGAVGIW